ncbi:class I SAM-dependent methyltransferase [Anabaena sp. FACHB-1250]|nr:class I SAM-dependent methyltransferase [Anabaena sp. FACHB-1250]MBD2267678.1 class I SAM-dependent methyltransferase [Anabaena sp. FACHB-1391]
MELYTIIQQQYNSVLKCPVCGYEHIFEHLVSYSGNQLHKDYIKCSSCGLVFSHPLTVPDYTDSHSSDLAGYYGYQSYVDIGAGIESMIRPLIALLTNSIPNLDNFLDVGCGFGYSVKFASSLMGANAIGYEPGEYGKIGSKVMDVNIINEYFSSNSSPEKYTVIFSSEVIEHIPYPYDYLQTLCNNLQPEGIAVLTTPNNQYLHECLDKKDNSDIKAMALLNPGQHLCLFNRESIIFLLKKCGISQYKIFEEDASLIIYFSHHRDLKNFNFVTNDEARSCYLKFLFLLLKNDKNHTKNQLVTIINKILPGFIKNNNHNYRDKLITRFQLGTAYRLMRELTNDGDFKNAKEIQQKYELLYQECFDITVNQALASIDPHDILECANPLSILELFTQRKVSFNLYAFLFYKTNLTLNDGKEDLQSNLLLLIDAGKKATAILASLFVSLKDNPLALTWFCEYFRLYPRFCFGLAILHIHANRGAEALAILEQLLVMIAQDSLEIDSRLIPDCLLQKSVIFLRDRDLINFSACTQELTTNYPQFSASSGLLAELIQKAEEFSI